MSDLFYIESECCVDGQCDTYAGEVSIIDIVTFDIHIAMDGQDGKTIKRDLKSPEFTIKDDGSWYINKSLGSDKFEIIVKQS